MRQIFKMNDAARYLTKVFPQKNHREWWGYLKWNPKRWQQQDGILINFTEVDRKAIYTLADLEAFATAYRKVV
ncbi:TPA: hypothetical protein NNR36_004553 [Salmonella enterica]|uniref:hypothetical protein n=1 Tax=Acinetobacter indicus TaxID=756892 RepID=UPI0032B475BC|nr:hypothetical protein [Salmonella enterica]HCH8780913.1 hypothetical protein [Salmonella enterica]HCH9129658.1 hypothetical protein [Salmonella enterica]